MKSYISLVIITILSTTFTVQSAQEGTHDISDALDQAIVATLAAQAARVMAGIPIQMSSELARATHTLAEQDAQHKTTLACALVQNQHPQILERTSAQTPELTNAIELLGRLKAKISYNM